MSVARLGRLGRVPLPPLPPLAPLARVARVARHGWRVAVHAVPLQRCSRAIAMRAITHGHGHGGAVILGPGPLVLCRPAYLRTCRDPVRPPQKGSQTEMHQMHRDNGPLAPARPLAGSPLAGSRRPHPRTTTARQA